MNKEIYLCWLDDIPSTIKSYNGHIELLKLDYKVEFIIDIHTNSDNFDTIARNINDDLIFLIDYNLKSNSGEGLDGDEVIKLIKTHNKECRIVFYSSKATQAELRELIKEYPDVICVLREQLTDILRSIADGSL